MKVIIEIPKEFEKHFDKDRFEDSLKRLLQHLKTLSRLMVTEYRLNISCLNCGAKVVK